MEGSKVKDLLPTMKTLKSVDDIPLFSHVQVKTDGEAGYINYNRNGFSFILNKWGRKRSNLPALNQFINAMNQTDIQSAELLCELYAKEHGKPLILPRFIHLVKSHNPADHLKVHIGIWDLISVNNVKTSEPPHRKWQTISGWVKNCTHVSVLPYMTPNSRLAINGFWKYHVEKLGYEGLVVRTSNGIYKLKPKGELDAVIIGINKKSGYGKTNLFAQKQVTSLKLALMTPEGNFVEVGDVASGIDHQLRSALWRLIDFKTGEDDKTVYVKPIAVLTVEYTDLFKSRNKILQLTSQGYRHVGDMNLIRFRHPRLKRLRSDKKVNPQDLRLEQIPQQYIEE